VFLLVFLLHLLAKAILVVLMGVLNAETSNVFGLLVIDLLIFHGLHVSLFILTTEGGKVFAIHIVLQSLSLLVILFLIVLHHSEEHLAIHFLFVLLFHLELSIFNVLSLKSSFSPHFLILLVFQISLIAVSLRLPCLLLLELLLLCLLDHPKCFLGINLLLLDLVLLVVSDTSLFFSK
jgi:hypothetical protein